jgi:PAS domain S-box-containing protein
MTSSQVTRQAEEALAFSEDALRAITGAMPVPLMVSRRSDLVIMMVNDHFARLAGLDVSNAVGRSILDFFHDDADRRVIDDVLEREGFVFSHQFRAIGADGSLRWVVASSQLVLVDDEPAYLSAFHDVTDRKNAEDELWRIHAELEQEVILRTKELTVANVRLTAEIEERRRIESEQQEHLSFERLVSDLSHRFVGLSAERIEEEIASALQRIVEFFGVDRCSLYAISADRRDMRAIATHTTEGVRHVPEVSASELFPYTWPKFLSGEAIVFSSLDELPEAAAVDRESFRAFSVMSNVTIPISVAETPGFVFSLGSSRAEHSWDHSLLPRIRLVAEVLVTAYARSQSDIASRDSRLRLAEAQRIARIGNWMWDMVGGEVSWSAELFDILGYDPESTRPSKDAFLDRVHPEDRPRVEAHISALISEREPFSIDHRIMLPDGSVKSVNSIARVECGPDDTPVRLFGIAQDITERKRYEEELEIKDRAIASSISGIGITDLEGRLVYVNDSLVKMWGFDSPEEILGRYLPEFWEGDGVARTVEDLQSRGVSAGEDVGKRKDGSLFPVEYSARMLSDGQGKPLYMYGSFVDISDRKRATEALTELGSRLINAQEEERSRIARELHDDVSQRLALMTVELELIGQAPSESATGLAERTAALSERIKELSSDIQRLCYRLHPRSLARLGLAVAIRSLCREMSEPQAVELRFEENDVPESLSDDVALCLYRVAQESLRNVINHSRAENAEVVLSATQEEIRLVVTDTGVGYEHDQIRERDGLGIISMRERLRAVGGRLSIESATDQGTRVEAAVPLAENGRSGGA